MPLNKFPFEVSPAKKGTCPSCKHTNKFRYYKNLPREFGYCERTNNCDYHNSPYKESAEKQKELHSLITNTIVEMKPEPKIIYPSVEYINKLLLNANTTFHTYLKTNLSITDEHFKTWGVGGENNKTVFINQNKKQVLNAKFFVYNDNCKRNKKINYSLVAKNKTAEKYSTCLYGEHLLGNDKIICLVKGEKSAVISAFIYPQFDWLATGGANGLTVAKAQILKDREVYYLADNDKAGNKNSSLDKLQLYNIKFKKVTFASSQDGEDLADLILRGERPENKPNIIEVEIISDTDLKTEKKSTYQLEHETFEKYTFFERDNEYYTKIQLKNSTKDVRISNFKMKIISKIIDGSDNMPVLIELIRYDGIKSIVEINSKDLHNPVMVSATIFGGGFNYNGSNYIYKNILESLHDDKNVATYITTLGQQLKHNFYAFCNGILTTNGDFMTCNELGFVIHNNETFYIPSAKIENSENENFTDDIKFRLVNSKLTLELFTQKMFAIYGINGLIGLCYAIATIHRDIIFSETKCFPFIFLYGGKGSGKSTYLDFFMNLFGDVQPPITEDSTTKSLERKFAQINNNIQYIKEFSPTFEAKTTNILKNAYDGVGYSRAQISNNNKTKTNTVRSGLIIDGNYFPTKDSALFSRLIFINWKPKQTDASALLIKEVQDFLKEGNGNGLIFTEIYKKRDYYKSHFSKIYSEVIQVIKVLCRSRKIYFSERETKHITLMAVVFKISIKSNTEAYNQFIDCLIEGTKTQMQINDSIDDVNKFFEGLETLENSARFTNHQYYYKRESTTDYDYLHINFNSCYLEYAKFQRDLGIKEPITQEELKQKLKFVVSQDYYIAENKEVYSTEKFGDKASRSLVFNVDKGTFNLIK